jgi:hypothetical protein
MNKKKIIGLVAIIIVVVIGLPTAFFVGPSLISTQQPSQEMDFVVTAKSDCLRFLNSSVPTFYVPFTLAANENWQLTINCTKMPGGANGWTEVYLYKDYWDRGVNNICKAEDLYPIISDIQSVDFEIKANQPYTETFGESTQQSYTVFFVVPPGGPSVFHVTLKQL